MRELFESERRFIDLKNAKHYIWHNRISTKFYLSVREQIIKGSDLWEGVFSAASFDDCVGFLGMHLYESSPAFHIARKQMLEIIKKEKGEKRYWLLVRFIPFFRTRESDGNYSFKRNYKYVTEEMKKEIIEIADEIRSESGYSIFAWSANGVGNKCYRDRRFRCSTVNYLLNEINLKVAEMLDKKSLKIKALRKGGKKKFSMD